MNNFLIGDKVIYPNQGIGIIEDIQDERYFGEEFHIYHLRILANNTLILVPFSNTDEIGIRKLESEEKIEKIYFFIRNGMIDVTMNWKGRYKEHLNLMKTGFLEDVALVLKSLFYLNLIKPLSFREKKMMEKAKDMIVSEISEVADVCGDDIEKKLLDDLSSCFKNVPNRVDS